MCITRNLLIGTGLLAALAGCAGPSYEEQRPPLDELDRRDYGSLQSKDVLQASDKLAMDLLSLPELNADRDNRWYIVVDRMDDRTSGRHFRGDFDLFLRRLETNLAKMGRGRIQLVENLKQFRDVRDRELEGERDDFGQGEGGRRAPQAEQPDFALRGTAMDLPGRGTTYYYLQFELVDLQRREQVWTDDYEVRVGRK